MNGTRTVEEIRNKPELCLKLAHSICVAHRVSPVCTRINEGSQLVFSSEDRHIIKIFSPEDRVFHRNETVFLQQIHQQLPVKTPELSASGIRDGFPYIIMEKLAGIPLSRVWNSFPASERRNLISRLGEAVCALRAVPADLFSDSPFHWHPFIDNQCKSLLDIHRKFGLGQPWISQLNTYMEQDFPEVHNPEHLVPLHTELMPEHVIVRQVDAGWTLAGLVDFEPSMIGHAEYEHCAVGLFLTPGDTGLFRTFLSSCGYADSELTPALSRRIMQLLLLHRYGNLHRFLSQLPAHLSFTDLEQLEQYWFGL